MQIDIEQLCCIAKDAGTAIMDIYDGEHQIEFKEDKSPLTAADKASHDTIVAGLTRHFPGIPILSEEGADISYQQRREWPRFWLVDPLDGTKEFIKRNGEFTVNIALIEGNQSILGVVYVPAQDKFYYGSTVLGAFTRTGDEAALPIQTRMPADDGFVVVMSRSHPSPELSDYLETIKVKDALSIGSSLKLCVVAEGCADLYPRLGPTMEWDTAAGHAVVVAAGGQVVQPTGEALIYNKESLLNPSFIVRGT